MMHCKCLTCQTLSGRLYIESDNKQSKYYKRLCFSLPDTQDYMSKTVFLHDNHLVSFKVMMSSVKEKFIEEISKKFLKIS